MRTDPAVPASIAQEAAQWGLAADEFQATAGWPPQLYVRESIRLRGLRVLTQADVCCAATASDPDSVGLSQWLIDVHAVRRIAVPPTQPLEAWDTVDAGDVNTQHETWQLTEIPYGALVPAFNDTTNLFAPVCASMTHIAFATYRLEAQYTVFGQSSAVAAVLALRSGAIDVQKVSVPSLQSELAAQGQLLNAGSPSPAVTAQSCVPGVGSSTQQWGYVPSDGTLRLSGASGSVCASVYGYSKSPGAPVWSAPCHAPINASNQHFDLVAAPEFSNTSVGVFVRSRLSGLCIAASGTSVATSAPQPPSLVQVQCNNETSTLWRVPSPPAVGLWQLAEGCLGSLGGIGGIADARSSYGCLCATSGLGRP